MDSLTAGGNNAISPVALALGLPGVILSLAIVGAAAVSAGGGANLYDHELTLAEAAALHDTAEIVRLVRAGHDPRQAAAVRAGVIREQPMVLTPMEAAILERRVDVIALLADVGAAIRADEFARYWCLAQARGDAAVIAAVESQVPQPAPVDCSSGGSASPGSRQP
jgi:hypothetical protein